MNVLYAFNIEMPLPYYTYALRDDEHESEFVMGIDKTIAWEEEYEVNESDIERKRNLQRIKIT